MTQGCGSVLRCFPPCVPHLISSHLPWSGKLGCCFQGREQAFLCQMSLERVKDVQLLVWSQSKKLLDDFRRVWPSYKAGDVNIYKCGHEVLTVETIHDSSMTWNGVCKVLDFEGPFEATGEKPSKRSHDGGKC